MFSPIISLKKFDYIIKMVFRVSYNKKRIKSSNYIESTSTNSNLNNNKEIKIGSDSIVYNKETGLWEIKKSEDIEK
jgi:hypothetical protein